MMETSSNVSKMAITELRAAGDGRHFILYTESPQLEEALRNLDHCTPLGTYYSPRGSKFAQDLMFGNDQKGQVEKLLKRMGNSSD